MKVKTKIKIDRIIGKPVAYVLNICARTLGFLLGIDHSLSKPVKNIVVCKFMGMGSIIHAGPMLQTLRTSFPSARIIFVTSSVNREILELQNLTDEIVTINDGNFFGLILSSFTALLRLWRININLYFDLELYSYFSTILSTASLAINRFGYYRRSNKYRIGIYTHLMYFNTTAPLSQVYLQLCRMAGCKNVTETLPPLPVGEKETEGMKSKLRTKYSGIFPGQYMVINPNASGLLPERRWGKNNFSEIINITGKKFPGLNIVLTGNTHEIPYTESILDNVTPEIRPCVISTAGLLTVPELVALISGCNLLLSCDSGPMHIGMALKKNTIGLFGPCSPAQYLIPSEKFLPLYRQVYCSPCVHQFDTPPCNGNNQCMQLISVKEVAGAVLYALEKNILPGTGLPGEAVFNIAGIGEIRKA